MKIWRQRWGQVSWSNTCHAVVPRKRRKAVEYVRDALGRDRGFERRACRVLGQPRSTQRRRPYIPDHVAQTVEIRIRRSR